MDDSERKQVAAEMIAAALDRLKKQALLNELHHLGDVIEVARKEAQSIADAPEPPR